jgi:hypothetical protein
LELHEPGIDTLEAWLGRNANGGIKLSPAADVPDNWHSRAELEWISRGGECRQLMAWFGRLAELHGQRRATLLSPDGHVIAAVFGVPEPEEPVAKQIGRYLYEPDAAVLAAGLKPALARQTGLAIVERGLGYLTGDAAIAHPALDALEVLDVLPLDFKRIRAALLQRGVGRVEVKKRGVPHDPAEVTRRLRSTDEGSAIVVLTRHRGRHVAVLARRVPR